MPDLHFELEFRVRTARLTPATTLVSVAGELDLHTLPQLESALAGLDGRETPTLIVDLTDVTFLDSTALGSLVVEARRRAARGHALLLVCDDRTTLRTFEVTGVLRYFDVRRTLRDAVEHAPPQTEPA